MLVFCLLFAFLCSCDYPTKPDQVFGPGTTYKQGYLAMVSNPNNFEEKFLGMKFYTLSSKKGTPIEVIDSCAFRYDTNKNIIPVCKDGIFRDSIALCSYFSSDDGKDQVCIIHFDTIQRLNSNSHDTIHLSFSDYVEFCGVIDEPIGKKGSSIQTYLFKQIFLIKKTSYND